MLSAFSDSTGHVRNANTAVIVRIAVCQLDLFPVPAGAAQFYRSAEAVRIWYEQRSCTAMNFDIRQRGACLRIEARDERAYQPLSKSSTPARCRWRLYFDFLPRFFSLVIVRSGYEIARGTRYAVNRAEQGHESCQIVRTHIEHRSAADLIIKFRIRMPALMAAADHETGQRISACRSRHRQSACGRFGCRRPGTFPARWQRAALSPRQLQHLLAFLARNDDRLLYIHMLAGFQCLQADRSMRFRNRQVHDDFDLRVSQELLDRIGLSQVELHSACFRAFDIDIGCSDELDFR